MPVRLLDTAIIGGGIAGASVGCFLSSTGGRVGLFEMESSLAYHTTGRSAALLTPFYGPDSMRAFAAVASDFFYHPRFDTDKPLVTPKRVLSVVRPDDIMAAERPPHSLWWNETQVLREVPFLKRGLFAGAVVDTCVAAIDVHELHSMYVRQFNANSGEIFTNAKISEIRQTPSGVWEICANGKIFQTPVIVNAAGAWGDEIARIASVPPVGLIPKRRTVVMLSNSDFENTDFDLMHFVIVEPDYLYFQNFGSGKLMMSPIDQTPSPPCDAQPEELDVAVTVERFEKVTTLKVRQIDHTWAGLRTFSADLDPVIGFEPGVEGFFWLAGQGGYGIFSSPAIGQYAASLIGNTPLPDSFGDTGFRFESLSPERFRLTENF